MVITGRTRNAFAGFPARGFESHLLRHVGASFGSLAPIFMQKNRGALMPLPPLFAKNHARLVCSVVDVLSTAYIRYQSFTSFGGSNLIFKKPENSLHMSFIKIPVAIWVCRAFLYFQGRTTDTKTK